MAEWIVDPKWQSLLEEAGIRSYQDALSFSKGTLLSRKSHSSTWMVQGKAGCFFVKQDSTTLIRVSLRNLLRFTKPLAATQKERLKMERLSGLGFHTAQVIAYGSVSRFGLAHSAVLITLPVPGRSVDSLWREGALSEARRNEVAGLALETLKQLQEKGCDWGKDCKPEHFFVSDNRQVHLIDVERMRFRGRPLPPEKCAWQVERFNQLLPV